MATEEDRAALARLGCAPFSVNEGSGVPCVPAQDHGTKYACRKCEGGGLRRQTTQGNQIVPSQTTLSRLPLRSMACDEGFSGSRSCRNSRSSVGISKELCSLSAVVIRPGRRSTMTVQAAIGHCLLILIISCFYHCTQTNLSAQQLPPLQVPEDFLTSFKDWRLAGKQRGKCSDTLPLFPQMSCLGTCADKFPVLRLKTTSLDRQSACWVGCV